MQPRKIPASSALRPLVRQAGRVFLDPATPPVSPRMMDMDDGMSDDLMVVLNRAYSVFE